MNNPKVTVLPIKVYAINVKNRTDRKAHIVNQFLNRSEFDLTVLETDKHPIGAVGLWLNIRKIISLASSKGNQMVLICEDDHEFTPNYNKDDFLTKINQGIGKEMDILAGGLSWFDCCVQIDKELFWVNQFRATQYIVIYKRFYDKILEADFHSGDSADSKLSNLSSSVFVTYPFISMQKEFGYSDTIKKEYRANPVTDLFTATEKKFEQINSVNYYYELLP